MELYNKEFEVLNDKESRVMVAKAARRFSSNSKKLSYVHISPETVEKCEGYNMAITHSGDRCIRLLFTKSYAKTQTKAMMEEIKQLAAQRLKESLGDMSLKENQAFKEALEYLAK